MKFFTSQTGKEAEAAGAGGVAKKDGKVHAQAQQQRQNK